MNTSRRVSVGGFTNWGDQIRYVTDPYLGQGTQWQPVRSRVRPQSRLQSELSLTTSSFTDVRTDTNEFTIRIYRLLTTYQFTERLLLRNIIDYNNYDRTLGGNLLLTYRVNSGTALYIGYDDRYREAVSDQRDTLLRTAGLHAHQPRRSSRSCRYCSDTDVGFKTRVAADLRVGVGGPEGPRLHRMASAPGRTA